MSYAGSADSLIKRSQFNLKIARDKRYRCEEKNCIRDMNAKTREFSIRRYGHPVCYDHQKARGDLK
jgi:hypothetical protein